MIEVKANYVNLVKEYANGNKTDYFVYTDVMVQGHAERTGYTNNIRVCAGVSACCQGIIRLIYDRQFHIELKRGYFHVWTNKKELRTLDKDSVYALNTLVCQLYELSKSFPKAFKSFELNDVKEKYDVKRKTKPRKSKRFCERNKMGIYPCEED